MIEFACPIGFLGFVSITTLLLSLPIMRIRQIPKQRQSLVELAASGEELYSIFCIPTFFDYIDYSIESFISSRRHPDRNKGGGSKLSVSL
jgi:hypothetical protein